MATSKDPTKTTNREMPPVSRKSIEDRIDRIGQLLSERGQDAAKIVQTWLRDQGKKKSK